MNRWWKPLIEYARPHKGSLAVITLCMFGGILAEILIPWPLKLIVDHVLADSPMPEAAAWISELPAAASPAGAIVWLATGTVFLYILSRSIDMLQTYIQSGLGNRMIYALGGDLFDHIQQLSLRFHGQARTGDLVRRITTDSICVRELIIGVLLPLLTSVATLVFMFVIIWSLDPVLALVAVTVAVPLVILIKLNAKRMMQRSYAQQEAEGGMMALQEQVLSAIPVIQTFGREDDGDLRFRALSVRCISAYIRLLASQMQFKVSVNGATAAGTAIVMGVGGMHVLEGQLSLGSLLVVLAYLVSLYAPMETLGYLSEGYASAAARARRVFEVLEQEQAVTDAPDAIDLEADRHAATSGAIQLKNVTFGYNPGEAVLKDINLEIHPGETVALAGHSGAGKTTLASLIARVFDPWSGEILIDGHPATEIRIASLRKHIALVLQDPFLLPLSIADNIAYGRPDAEHDEIVAAAVAANAHEFIRRLPDGYDTIIGQQGGTLSGGEKQRLAIARALLKDAPILILDEPTAALDAGTEASVLEALARLMKHRTTLVIAHRLSTIRNSDRIFVLDNGMIAESGTHSELVAAKGRYRELFGPAPISVPGSKNT